MKLKAIIFFLFGFVISYGQAPLNFTARMNVTSVTGSDPYTIVGVIQDGLGLWSAADLNASADSIYHLEGSDLLIYRITSISSASGNNFTIIVDDINNTGTLPSTGTEWGVVEFTTNYQFPIEVGNLATTLKASIDNRFKQRLDDRLLLLEADAAFYSTSDTTTYSPSSPAPTNGDFAWWKNRGQLLEEKNGFSNRVTSKNGELVNFTNKVTVSWAVGDTTFYDLNSGNRFYTSFEEDIILNVLNLEDQESGDIFEFELVNATDEGVPAYFASPTFRSFDILGVMETQWFLQESSRIFTFKVTNYNGTKYLVSCDDLNAAVQTFVPTDGVYSPTLYTVSTDTIKEVYPHFYEIGDSIITVSGKFRVNSTAGTVVTSVQIQMPPGGTFNFTDNNTQINGQVFAATRGLPFTNYYGYVFANTSTDRMEVSFKSDETTATEQYVEYIVKYRKK